MIRTLFLVSLLFVLYSAASAQAVTKELLVGSWELVETSKEPVRIEQLAAAKEIFGTLRFNADDTFESVMWDRVKFPSETYKDYGRYSVKKGILTIFNQKIKSQGKSVVTIRNGILIIKAITKRSDGYTAYYRRARAV